MKIKTRSKTVIADMTTPVKLFTYIRQHYQQSVLLESAAYAKRQDHLSFIAFDSIGHIEVNKGVLSRSDGMKKNEFKIADEIKDFMGLYELSQDDIAAKYNGIYGFSNFDAVQYFEDISFDDNKDEHLTPHLRYDLYRYVFVFDHYYSELSLIENRIDGEISKLDEVWDFINKEVDQIEAFSMEGEEGANMKDEEYLDMVAKAKMHCKRGDVFQLVLSRRFSQAFKGDDFNVYRALRSINPSPYLYYFDYGAYHIFGSSPEAQIKVTNRTAEIHPIAGTYKRTMDQAEDQKLAEALMADEKETAEHVMLVDLARNDLSINTENVKVTTFKEAQYFSHVIHLTSVVKGTLKPNVTNFQIFADTFPAGTLSGAPKYKAMQLINEYEPHARSFYGGGLGVINFNGNLNHAIIISSFLSLDQTLHYQSGAGLVMKSNAESELQEVNNKLAALKKALYKAEKF